MLLARLVVWMFAVGIMVLAADVVSAQNYPNKPIRIVAPEAGGGSDLAARLIAQELTGSLGQHVIVENRGGSVNIPAQIVVQAPPDGYTLLFASGNLWLAPFLQEKAPFDPVRDLSPISLTNRAPNILVVNPSLPVSSVKELIALAKTKPGELNFGTSGTGSSSHLAAELFKAMAGVNIVRIPYKGLGPATNDLISGQLQLMIPNAASVMPHVKSGRLRALAVTSAQPSALAPGLPTVAASGLPGYESASMNGMFAPATTPVTLINRLNREIVRVLNRADVKEKFFNAGVETIGSSPQELAATVKSEMARLGKVIKDTGIRGE